MTTQIVLSSAEYENMTRRWPDRIPIIVTRHSKAAADVPDLPKRKFIVPRDLTIGQFLYVIRKHIKLPPEKAIFIFIGDMLPVATATIAELYNRFKSPDNALHIVYTSESTFGSEGSI
jgi:GABA(A) receptor-associated protein